MYRSAAIFLVNVICFVCFWANLFAQSEEEDIVSLSDSIGYKISIEERQRYHLFPDIEAFQSARILRLSESKYRLEYSYGRLRPALSKSRTISGRAIDLTRLHVKLVEDYLAANRDSLADREREADLQYRLMLKYAYRAEYDIASRLLNDLIADYPESEQAEMVRAYKADVGRLWRTKEALIWTGSLLDQSGRTDILVFSGYYGVWLGIATPIYFEANEPEAFGAGLLLGGPLSLLIASGLTKEANVSDGRATMISLGGHLGTWQGVGWAVVADKDGHEVVGLGELAGLAGIAGATLLTKSVNFSEGHAALTSSGLQWGAWFGLIVGDIADHSDDDLLRDMLIGSDALIVGTGIAASNVRMSQARVRLINLAGVLGTVFGFGIDLIAQPDESATVLAIAGTGSIVGLAMGTQLTRDYDKDRELGAADREFGHVPELKSDDSSLWSVAPTVSLQQDQTSGSGAVPFIGFTVRF